MPIISCQFRYGYKPKPTPDGRLITLQKLTVALENGDYIIGVFFSFKDVWRCKIPDFIKQTASLLNQNMCPFLI